MSSTPKAATRRKQKQKAHPHGWFRANDRPEAIAAQAPFNRRAPAGTSFLLGLLVALLAVVGIVRVHATTKVLELGGEITELTAEQARLLERKRRLSAERAYLRRPAYVGEIARDRLGLVPIAPELVQRIPVIETETP